MLRWICLVFILLVAENCERVAADLSADISEIKSTGYDVQIHNAFTEDGFVLRMLRLSRRSSSKTNYRTRKRKLPVLLLHGIVGSSHNYLSFPDSLGYQLVDAGFDVFLGNLRGNVNTKHYKYSRNDNRFWNFGIDEQAQYDLPAMINRVLKITGADKLYLITYSMSFTEFVVMSSYRPEMVSKVRHLVGLAPTLTAQGFLSMARLGDKIHIEEIFNKLNAYQIPPEIFFTFLAKNVCTATEMKDDFCVKFIMSLTGDDYNQIDLRVWPKQLSRVQSASRKQVLHYKQMVLSNKFAAYDYGGQENMKIYRQAQAPAYNISKEMPSACLFFGNSDKLQPIKAKNIVADMISSKSNNVTVHRVPYDKFGHLSFIFAKDAGKFLNKDVVECLIESDILI